MKALNASYSIFATHHVSATMMIALEEPANFPAAFLWNNTIYMFYTSVSHVHILTIKTYEDGIEHYNAVAKFLVGTTFYDEIEGRLDTAPSLAHRVEQGIAQQILDKLETGTIAAFPSEARTFGR